MRLTHHFWFSYADFWPTDSLSEVTALNMFTGREVPVIISAKTEFLGHLDTVIGERLHVFEVCSIPCCGCLWLAVHSISLHALFNFHHLNPPGLSQKLLGVKSWVREYERVIRWVSKWVSLCVKVWLCEFVIQWESEPVNKGVSEWGCEWRSKGGKGVGYWAVNEGVRVLMKDRETEPVCEWVSKGLSMWVNNGGGLWIME